MTFKSVAGPQGDLCFEVQGQGLATPLLFVHSDGGNRRHWRSAIEHFSPGRRVAAFDRRGHGQSATPRNGDYSVAGRSEDILAVADAVDFQRSILVGHSGGGGDAFLFAQNHPDRVAGLVLLDPIPDSAALPREMLDAQLTRMRGGEYEAAVREYHGAIAGPDERVASRVLADALATPKPAMIGVTEALLGFEPRKALGGYKGPALSIIQSQYDSLDALHRIGGFAHRVIDGSGHWIQLAAPEAFEQALEGFIDDVETQAPVRTVENGAGLPG